MSRVVVISGGTSTEHTVSLASGADVAASLRERHDVLHVVIEQDGTWVATDDAGARHDISAIADLDRDDVVFPALHGGWGEGGGLQTELDDAGIAYVGCDAAASATCMSKAATARAAAAAGVEVIPARLLTRTQYGADPDLITAALARSATFPLIVKPDAGGSSVGVHVATDARTLRAALDDAFRCDALVMLQPLVVGAEVSIGVWSDDDGILRATGASLVHLPDGAATFDYDHKYGDAGARLEIPATLPTAVLADLQDAALRTAAAVRVIGLSRIDFFVVDGRPVLNEVNTMPGIRRASHFPRLVAAAGTVYDDLLDTLVRLAVRSRVARTTG